MLRHGTNNLLEAGQPCESLFTSLRVPRGIQPFHMLWWILSLAVSTNMVAKVKYTFVTLIHILSIGDGRGKRVPLLSTYQGCTHYHVALNAVSFPSCFANESNHCVRIRNTCEGDSDLLYGIGMKTEGLKLYCYIPTCRAETMNWCVHLLWPRIDDLVTIVLDA